MKDTITVTDVLRGTQIIKLLPVGVLICDIDGTIADIGHRLGYIEQQPKDWDSFFAACVDDGPIFEIIFAVQEFSRAGWTIVYCTGRRADERTETEQWMQRYGLPQGALMMRRSRDRRPDVQVKGEMLAELIRNGLRPDLVLEDRQRVVDMWRNAGIRCVQVREGSY